MSPRSNKTIEKDTKSTKEEPSSLIDVAYISEKSATAQSLNKYTFNVPNSASRVDVRMAVEKKYGVKVISANVVKLPVKVKKFIKTRYIRPSVKKIIVTLRSGDKIDIIPQ